MRAHMGCFVCTLFLTLLLGCDSGTESEEALWVGVIDPANGSIEEMQSDQVQDSTVFTTSARSDEQTPGSEPVKQGQDPNRLEEEVVSQREESQGMVDSDGSSHSAAERTGTRGNSEEVTEASEQEEASEAPVEAGRADMEVAENTSGEDVFEDPGGAHPLDEAMVSFSVDLSCAGEVHEEHVYILGMDQWNEEWAIATHLEREGESHHYTGTWNGLAGEYTFLVSHGKVAEGQLNPWGEVEDIEGQSCAADAYGNRMVSATAGENTVMELTFGYCDGCPATCVGACGGTALSGSCFCEQYDDCCDDFTEVCAPTSCEGQCGGHNTAGNCYCDDNCLSYNDCCSDYVAVCENQEN